MTQDFDDNKLEEQGSEGSDFMHREEPEKTDLKCPECGGNMVKEMDRHQNYIYTCVGCGYTESE